jgi:hypothetical protein
MGLIKETDERRARQALEAFETLRQLTFTKSNPTEWSSKVASLAATIHGEIKTNDAMLLEVESLLQKISILRDSSNEEYFLTIENKSKELRAWNQYLSDYLQKVTGVPGPSDANRLCSELVDAMKRLKETVVTSVNR